MKKILSIVAITLLSTTAIASNHAADSEQNDALSVTTAKISLTQAIDIAEQHLTGKASRAEFENHKDQMVFDIEVISDNKVMDVKIDPESGKILAVKEDKSDHDGDHDKDDDKEDGKDE